MKRVIPVKIYRLAKKVKVQPLKALIISMVFVSLPFIGLAQNRIRVRLAEDLKGPYSGRLMVYAQADTSKPFGRSPEDALGFAIDVKNWKFGETKELDSRSLFITKPLNSVIGAYKLVAILDTNTKERGNNAPGNLYTRGELVATFSQMTSQTPLLVLTNTFTERKFKEEDTVKEVVLQSEILSKFRKEPIFMKAGVVLPQSYSYHPNKKYPVVYVIPGWGGTHHHAYHKGQQQAYGVGKGVEKIYVFLNPETQTPFGLHAFVDSRVNGPWGTALIQELIPYLESKFRISENPKHRLITGQSSGGYGAIWLALHFPEKFGGCWATSPDPIDFSSFTGVDIYRDENYFHDLHQIDRKINIINGQASTTLRKGFAKEQLEGDGGQQQSFEAEFGLPDKKGRPQALFDAKTGKINQKVAASWRPYDLALYVRQHWEKIKRQASNKIRIYAGEIDNYLLQHAVIAFEQKIKPIGAKIHVQIVKGADHFNTRQMVAETIQKEMDETLKRQP